MTYLKLIFLVVTLFSCCCESDSNTDNIQPLNAPYQIVNYLSYNDLVLQIGQEKLAQGVEQPGSDGALGRNKEGYFHVRFQINMTSISDFAVVTERVDALQYLKNTIGYSFNKQLEDGSFEFSPPDKLLNSPNYSPPVTGDLESGTAFFASSLGLSLLTLQNSNWFLSSKETEVIREKIEFFKPSIEKTLDYLLNKKNILKQYDAQAPNRLLFDALAFYSIGKYLSRTDAQCVAFEFIESALNLTDTEQGYFIEGEGWDSSYNGVAIKLAMELFSIIDDAEQKNKLSKVIIKATTWQISRINEKGMVSTEGNTRVYEGGETFLGEEKGVDYVKIVRAFYYFGNLTDTPDIIQLGDKVLDYYN